jgi:DNA (cytosine-5)-methyltransferase 1
MDAFLVNAVNYGAPQLRERLLIFGNRLGKVAEFPSPTHELCRQSAQYGHETSGTLFLNEGSGPLKPFRTLGDAIRSAVDPRPVVMDFSARKKAYLAMVPPGSNWRSLPPDVQRESLGKAYDSKGGRSGWWRRLSYDLPCPTLVTMPNHAGTALCHPEELRALSLREYALIQEFPSDWEFCGSVQEQYAQAGNAVPVRLGEVAGAVLASLLESTADKPGRVAAQEFSMEYIKSHIRTRRWFKRGQVYVWSDSTDNERAKYQEMKTNRARIGF